MIKIYKTSKALRGQRSAQGRAKQASYEQMIKTPPQTWSATHRDYAGTTIRSGGDSGGQEHT